MNLIICPLLALFLLDFAHFIAEIFQRVISQIRSQILSYKFHLKEDHLPSLILQRLRILSKLRIRNAASSAPE